MRMIRTTAVVVLPLAMACASSKGSTESPAAPTAGTDAGAPAAGDNGPPGSAGSSENGPGGKGGSAGSSASGSEAKGGAADGGRTAAEAAAPAARPFAHTPLEAQSLIQDQIGAHTTELWKCVEAYRQRKGDVHKAVVVDVGIDQEGTLLGVVAPNAAKKGALDPALRDCLMAVLHGLPFPRSHSGVITVRQNFTDAAISR
jgi:hypothetical protein